MYDGWTIGQAKEAGRWMARSLISHARDVIIYDVVVAVDDQKRVVIVS